MGVCEMFKFNYIHYELNDGDPCWVSDDKKNWYPRIYKEVDFDIEDEIFTYEDWPKNWNFIDKWNNGYPPQVEI